ncbi:MAG: UbiA-like protein EboC [Cyanobacteria bacterium P01_G01_bin.49]
MKPIQLPISTLKSEVPNQILAYLQLMRPANIVTAWADILAGLAIAGTLFEDFTTLTWLILATTGLYGGGIVFNDVFDAKLDAVERPERPIPSARASFKAAIILGVFLLFLGILAATQVSFLSAILAVFVAVSALVYDAWSKHHPVIGPLNMGICRGGNLLLGMSAVASTVTEQWYLALIPIVYIAAVTTISRGEVAGGKQETGILALGLLAVVLGSLLVLDLTPDYRLLAMLPFWVFFAARILPPWTQAMKTPDPNNIRQAVKIGVLSLIVLNATMGAGFAGGIAGLLILALLPLSKGLAQLFTVT